MCLLLPLRSIVLICPVTFDNKSLVFPIAPPKLSRKAFCDVTSSWIPVVIPFSIATLAASSSRASSFFCSRIAAPLKDCPAPGYLGEKGGGRWEGGEDGAAVHVPTQVD